MNLEVKKRAANVNHQSTRITREAIAPVVKPTIVYLSCNEIEAEERSKETSENVMKVYSVLAEIGTFPFYHFITDPQSLGRTVENLFYVSFLIRDNRARIFIPELMAESNELYIEDILPEDEEEEEPSNNVSNQLILTMSSKTWRKAIEKYNIEKAFLELSS